VYDVNLGLVGVVVDVGAVGLEFPGYVRAIGLGQRKIIYDLRRQVLVGRRELFLVIATTATERGDYRYQ
jgi:hypothetical protein